MKDQAAASTTAFLFAGVLFMAAIGSVLVTTGDVSRQASSSQQDTAVLLSQADGLLQVLLESPGYSSGDQDWLAADMIDGKEAPDRLVRLGLLQTGTGNIDFEKLRNLRLAPHASSATDGYVNYEDARTAMGLEPLGLDFHIRAHPSLKAVQDILDCIPADACRDPNLRVTYIGHAEATATASDGTDLPSDAGLGVSTPTCTARTDGKGYTVATTVSNGGDSAAQFIGIFKVDLVDDEPFVPFEDWTRSYSVAAGGSSVLAIDIPHKAGRSCEGARVQLEVWDNDKILGDVRDFTGLTGPTATTAVAADFATNPGRTFYVVGQSVQMELFGDIPTTGADDFTVAFRVLGDDGVETWPRQVLAMKGNQRTFELPQGAFTAGQTNYVVEVEYVSYQEKDKPLVAVDYIVQEPLLRLASGEPGSYTPPAAAVETLVPSTAVGVEAAFLDDLVDRFCPFYRGSTSSSPLSPAPDYTARCGDFKPWDLPPSYPSHAGDVMLDTKKELDNRLPERLLDSSESFPPAEQQCSGNVDFRPRYDLVNVLVVGSHVSHNSMTSAPAKYALCEWVFGGGTLIVFGSGNQQVQWLQPIFHAAIESSSGSVGTPDTGHPILNVADSLNPDAYNPHGKAWSFTGPTAQDQEKLLSNVVPVGDDSILSVSNPGAFGRGTVILTTWLPYDLFNSGTGSAEEEGMKLLNNFLMHGYRDLFLDYGPEIPSGVLSIPAQRVGQVWHPELERHVALNLELFVFPRQ